ncbi:unnamed protein product [Musa textilis]
MVPEKGETSVTPNNKNGLWCAYCKKLRHNKETCQKLHKKNNKEFKISTEYGQGQALEFSDKYYTSHIPNALKDYWCGSWVIDLVATNHMTNSLTILCIIANVLEIKKLK